MNWKLYEVYTIDQDGETFLLPLQADIDRQRETIRQLTLDLESEQNEVKRKAIETVLEGRQAALDTIKALLVEFREVAVKENFYLRKPTYMELIAAEDDSKDWLVGETRINEGRFSLKLMAERVKRGDKILNEQEVGQLDPIVGRALWEEYRVLTYPNPARLPFLKLPSTTPSTTDSPTP